MNTPFTKPATTYSEQVALLRQRGMIVELSNEVKRSEETFIRHLLANYAETLPPVWAVCEVMSLGLLSRWYNALKPMPTRRAIASVYRSG